MLPCPLCRKTSSPYPHHLLSLLYCMSCELIFASNHNKHPYTPNKGSWGKHDPRLTSATAEMKKHTFRQLFKLITGKSANQPTSQLATGKLLDIGTGAGFLLEVAKKFGYSPTGLEPDQTLASIARKKRLKIIAAPLHQTLLPAGSYDIITIIDVLEHIGDPLNNIKIMYSLLKDKGLLVISTPDVSSLSFKMLRTRWPHFKNEHLFYYSPKALRKLLEPVGFKILGIQPFPKFLTPEYAAGYFSAFPNPFFSPLARFLYRLSPGFLRRLPIKVFNGNLLLIARKII